MIAKQNENENKHQVILSTSGEVGIQCMIGRPHILGY